MNLSSLSFVAVSMSMLAWAAPAAAGVPMFNATCPGGVEVHADDGGPVYFNGNEATLKRFNDNYFEARDPSRDFTLSITRTPDGGLDLSYTGRGGANGVCTVARNSAGSDADERRPYRASSAAVSGDPSQDVTCESRDQRQTECDMDTRGEVRLVKQLSRGACEEGVSWGLNRNSIWVKDGCRGVFRNVSHAGHGVRGGNAPGGRGKTAQLNACNDRQDADGTLVTQVAVNDGLDEMIIDYPDGRYLCLVRTDATVQSLTRLRKR